GRYYYSMSYATAVRARMGPVQLREAARSDKLGAATISLAVLITSYFFCLPLGRFQIAGFNTDSRIYDYIFPATVVFTFGHLARAVAVSRDRSRFFYWARLVEEPRP